jgi:hypothetical protein
MQTHVTHYDPVATANQLAKLDSMMRSDLPYSHAVKARVAFFEQAVRLHATRRLNRLGELCPCSLLGDRSLDVVFEDPRYADDVLAGIVALADRDALFTRALDEQMGTVTLAFWRTRATRQGGLFASH